MSAHAIGGKVLDASFVAAFARDRITAATWLTVARELGVVLYLPALALVEVRAVRPGNLARLGELVSEPVVVLGDLDTRAAVAIDAFLERLGKFDALAGHVVYTARVRGWPALTDDLGRLHRLDPALEADSL